MKIERLCAVGGVRVVADRGDRQASKRATTTTTVNFKSLRNGLGHVLNKLANSSYMLPDEVTRPPAAAAAEANFQSLAKLFRAGTTTTTETTTCLCVHHLAPSKRARRRRGICRRKSNFCLGVAAAAAATKQCGIRRRYLASGCGRHTSRTAQLSAG